MSGSVSPPTPALKFWKASTSAKSSWPTPAVRCTTATGSRPCSPKISIEHGYADGSEYLGMVDPEPAAVRGLFDRSAGVGLDQLHQTCGDAAAERGHPRDLDRGRAIWRRAE